MNGTENEIPWAPGGKHMFGKMDHVQVAVADIEKALAFYLGTGGLKVLWDRELPTGVRLVMLAGKGEAKLELSSGPGNPAPGTIKHIGYKVADLDAAIREVEAAGLQFHRKPQKPEDRRLAFFRGPDGTEIELLEQ